jgi:hypothetical protein
VHLFWHLLPACPEDLLSHTCLDFPVPSGENMCSKGATEQPQIVQKGILITPSALVGPVGCLWDPQNHFWIDFGMILYGFRDVFK